MTAALAETDDPRERLRAIPRAFARALRQRPFLPQLMLREIAAGGPNLPPEAVEQIAEIMGMTKVVLNEGVANGVFRRVDPFITHLMLIGSLMFMANALRMRERFEDVRLPRRTPRPTWRPCRTRWRTSPSRGSPPRDTEEAPMRRALTTLCSGLIGALPLLGCGNSADRQLIHASGHIEATEVRLAAKVGGRLVSLPFWEGDRVKAGEVVAKLDTADAEHELARARAEADAADARLRLLLAGSRAEDIQRAEAELARAEADLAGRGAGLRAAWKGSRTAAPRRSRRATTPAPARRCWSVSLPPTARRSPS